MREIKFTYENKDYTLCYTRRTAEAIEQQGLNINKIQDKLLTSIPLLFYGAFMKNHKGIKRKLVDEIWEQMPNKDDLVPILVEMYAEAYEDLFSKGDEKNIQWEESN